MKTWAKETMLTPRKPNIFAVSLVYAIIAYMMDLIVSNLTGYNDFYNSVYNDIIAGELPRLSGISVSPMGVFFFMAAAIMSFMVSFGYRAYALGISRNREMNYWSLFEGFNYFAKCFLLNVIINIVTLIGNVLFVVPGIVLSCIYSQAYYILIDNPEKGVFQCMRESRILMRGHKMEYFTLELSFIGWYIMTYMPYFIGSIVLIWVTPYTELTFARYYNTITNDTSLESDLKGIETDDNSQ